MIVNNFNPINYLLMTVDLVIRQLSITKKFEWGSNGIFLKNKIPAMTSKMHLALFSLASS